jgi:hypothetical protein
MYSDGSVQMSMFDEPKQEPVKLVKVKFQWSIYAVPKYWDGSHIETIVNAYTEKQARFLFYKEHAEYMITGIYKC